MGMQQYLQFNGDSVCFEVLGVEKDAVNEGLRGILVTYVTDVGIL